MHMADALVSPAVGGTMWAASLGMAAYSAWKIRQDPLEGRVPLMGVLGAFIFAAQMINFAIPGTGSSGHLGGGLILAALLGPAAGFLTLVSILVIQALFFADGGLLALGCNIFNLGFYSCFVAYPLIYKPLLGGNAARGRMMAAAVLAAIAGLQLGALSVVLQTVVSGVSDLPFRTFVLVMQPIHLAIGVVEGLISAAVLGFLRQVRPELLVLPEPKAGMRRSRRFLLTGLLAGALVVGGIGSWFASSLPDGLEWSIVQTTGHEELANRGGVHRWLAELQRKMAVLPDYGFKPVANTAKPNGSAGLSQKGETSIAGLLGVGLTLGLTVLLGFGLKWLTRRGCRTER